MPVEALDKWSLGSTSHCLRMEWLAGIRHSINIESWQIERQDYPWYGASAY